MDLVLVQKGLIVILPHRILWQQQRQQCDRSGEAELAGVCSHIFQLHLNQVFFPPTMIWTLQTSPLPFSVTWAMVALLCVRCWVHRGAVHSLRAAEQVKCAQSGLQEPQTLHKSFYIILDKLSLLL